MIALSQRRPTSAATYARHSPRLTSVLKGDALLSSRDDGPDPWDQRIDELLAFRVLKDDWDGQGAEAPSAALVDNAIVLASLLRNNGVEAPHRVTAGVTGTVSFEWHWGPGSYGEIEVTRPFLADVFLATPNQPMEHWQIVDPAFE